MRHVPLVVCSLLVLGCAAAKPKPTVVKPLTPEQVKAFDRGVDFVATLEGLEGRWRADWDRDLQVRVGGADRIALVTVHTLRTDTDPEQRVTYRLVAHVERDLVGAAEPKEVELPARGDDPGFTSVHENLHRIPDQHFIAYIRAGQEGPYWHMSPASEPVVTETQRLITELARDPKKSDGVRVIVHTN